MRPGDAVLKELVCMAGRNIRSHDYIVRTEGQFLIILRSCPAADPPVFWRST